MRASSPGRLLAAALLALLLLLLVAVPAFAHERREVDGYTFVVGFIGEPVFTGQKSGLEFQVNRGEEPVEDLAESLTAVAIYQDQTLDLPLSPRFGQPGWYQSVFFPTAAGPYTFHITGTIDGTSIDESFTSSEEGFDEVREATAGQFPVQYPPMGDLVADVRRGADAASQLLIAIGLGAAGTLLGLLALGVALGSRRRSS
jgi:hypothetical protein